LPAYCCVPDDFLPRLWYFELDSHLAIQHRTHNIQLHKSDSRVTSPRLSSPRIRPRHGIPKPSLPALNVSRDCVSIPRRAVDLVSPERQSPGQRSHTQTKLCNSPPRCPSRRLQQIIIVYSRAPWAFSPLRPSSPQASSESSASIWAVWTPVTFAHSGHPFEL
jgi:hypothetical protein